MKGRHLDLNSPASSTAGNASAKENQKSSPRPFLGVHFVCCDIYRRIYMNPQGTHYLGNCPQCARQVRFQVGSGGTSSRFFKVQP